jgi:hypothetical protein
VRTAKVTPKKGPGAREWVDPFLAALRGSGNVRAACYAADVSRKVAYAYRAESAEFAEAWRDALAEAIDMLEEAARARALDSSDTLLIFLLKSHRPEVYRETTRHEHSGPSGGPIPVDVQRRDVALEMLEKLVKSGISEAEARAALVASGVREHDLERVS